MDLSGTLQESPHVKQAKTSALRKQKTERHPKLVESFQQLHSYRNALYHPETKQKLFIIDAGICLKRDCIVNLTKHKAKVLFTVNSNNHFAKAVPLDKIGQKVICFSHFKFEDQMHYFLNGSLPSDASPLQQGQNAKSKKDKNEKESDASKRASKNGSVRILSAALNEDLAWVKFTHYYCILFKIT